MLQFRTWQGLCSFCSSWSSFNALGCCFFYQHESTNFIWKEGCLKKEKLNINNIWIWTCYSAEKSNSDLQLHWWSFWKPASFGEILPCKQMGQTKCKTHLLKEQQKNIFQMGFLMGDQSLHFRLGKFPFLAGISFICMQIIQHLLFGFFFFQ